MKFPLGAIVCGITLLSGRVLAEEAKLDRAKAMEELKEIESKNEKLTQGLLEKAAKELTEAGSDKFKAVQIYLESYRNVEFGRAQDGETRFQQWRVENKEKIASLDFSTAAQLHVQYVALVCREALGEKEAPKAGEWGVYWENLFKSREIAESPGDLAEAKAPVTKKGGMGRKQKKESGNDFDRPAVESPLVRDRQIQGFLEGVQEAKFSSASVGPIFNQVVRPHLRKAKSRDLVRLWDLRIAAMDEGMGKEVKTLGLDDYKVLKRPELMWERADDLEKMGEQESAWAKKMEIIKSCPYHPKLAEWIGEMKQALGEGSPALPEKAP
jgi:outer membrane murein-binding lipoprotein Lpp